MKRAPSVATRLNREKGAVMPMIGFIIILLLALAAVAVDVGYILVTKQQLQNAADACALAAAPALIWEEPERTAQAQASAIDMAARHKAGNDASVTLVPAEDIIIQDTQPYMRVTVIARKLQQRGNGLPLFFARILGIHYADVTARATAEITPTASACCVKPWAIPDKWDDETLIPGYADWQNNNRWDMEEFTDADGDRVWDPGEAFQDRNNNGVYDSEHYDRELSQANQEGYIPENPPTGDIGVQITLKLNAHGDRPASSYFDPVVMPWPAEFEEGLPSQGASRYRESIIRCNPTVVTSGDELQVASEPGNMAGPTQQGAREIINEDPNAFWNEELNTVDHYGGGTIGESPRVVFIPVYDPRIWPGPGRETVVITKVVAFFIEDARSGTVTGRMTKAPVSCLGSTEPGGEGSFTWTPNLVE